MATTLTLAPPVVSSIGNRHVDTLTEEEQAEFLASKPEGERVLVFAPHPDDDVLGCGGQIIKHVACGDDVHIVYCSDTRGVGVFGMPEYDRLQLSETLAMAEALGVGEGRIHILDETPMKYREDVLYEDFLRILREVKPSVVYLPHPREGYRHPDHEVVFRAAKKALWIAPSSFFSAVGEEPSPRIKEAWLYEVWVPLEAMGDVPIKFKPISEETLEKKLAALEERVSQPADWYAHATRGLAAFRGAMRQSEPCEYAEAFVPLSFD